jgi:hypothetical protein
MSTDGGGTSNAPRSGDNPFPTTFNLDTGYQSPKRSKDTVIDLAYQAEKTAELARQRAEVYSCWDCGQPFSIQISGWEMRGSLDVSHDEACPGCGQVAGKGRVKCQRCQGEFVVDLPHWHAVCDMAWGRCPHCGETYSSGCGCSPVAGPDSTRAAAA